MLRYDAIIPVVIMLKAVSWLSGGLYDLFIMGVSYWLQMMTILALMGIFSIRILNPDIFLVINNVERQDLTLFPVTS